MLILSQESWKASENSDQIVVEGLWIKSAGVFRYCHEKLGDRLVGKLNLYVYYMYIVNVRVTWDPEMEIL
jgi:hypothetical protein